MDRTPFGGNTRGMATETEGMATAAESITRSVGDEPARQAGDLLREARKSRRLSQLDLALKVGASQRHLSFVETGRSMASRGMLIALADALGMSPAGCNQLLLASGFAPRYSQRALDERHMEPVRQVLDHLLAVHDPMPAWVLDPCWNLLQFNRGADRLLAGITGKGLSERQIELLDAYGYPYVFEEFRFHMTLTDRLDDADARDIATAASTWFGPVLEEPVLLDRLVLFHEAEAGKPFRRVGDFKLGAAP